MGNDREAGVPERMSKGRVEALSDGVFAIVVTLLVLELRVPHIEAHESVAELAGALLALAPKFVSWVISFVTVCVIWLNHHRLFALISRLDNGLFWCNANLLLWTSFIPFPTALMGDYPGNPLAASLYGVVMFLMASAFVLIRWQMLRHPELMAPETDRAWFRAATRFSMLMGPVAYAVGAGLAWVSAIAAVIGYAVVAFYFVLPHQSRRRTA